MGCLKLGGITFPWGICHPPELADFTASDPVPLWSSFPTLGWNRWLGALFLMRKPWASSVKLRGGQCLRLHWVTDGFMAQMVPRELLVG